MAFTLSSVGARVLEFGTFITGRCAAPTLGHMGTDLINTGRVPLGDPVLAEWHTKRR